LCIVESTKVVVFDHDGRFLGFTASANNLFYIAPGFGKDRLVGVEGEEHTVVVWDLSRVDPQTGAYPIIQRLEGHTDQVYGITKYGDWLFTCEFGDKIIAWG
jgi:hypothetical protein